MSLNKPVLTGPGAGRTRVFEGHGQPLVAGQRALERSGCPFRVPDCGGEQAAAPFRGREG